MSAWLSAAIAVYCFLGFRIFLRRMWAYEKKAMIESTAEKLIWSFIVAILLCWAWPALVIAQAGKWIGRFISWTVRGDADRFIRIIAGRTREQRRMR